MKNILIFYFSATGNTRRIAKLYRDALQEECSVELKSLPLDCNVSEICFDKYELIGIGYPIHAFNAPENVLKFAKSFPKRDKRRPKKRVFVFKTSGEPVRMSDVSSLKLDRILKRRGYSITNEYQYVMPYNIIFRHTDAQAYKMLETAKALVPIDCKEILSGKRVRPKCVPFGAFVAGVLRIEQPGARLIGKYFKATNECVKCGLCVKNCPAHNIKWKECDDGSKKIEFGNQCLICMRCVFTCPEDAIRPGILNNWRVNGAYSFAPPETDEPRTDKFARYCQKAYDRYYANAEKKIRADKNASQDPTENA